MTLDELVTQVRAAYGERLASIVLYGSAAAGERTKQSDYNILLLLDRIDASILAAASAVARAWRDAGNPPPLTMTLEEWRGSADVFPMEYADILERHRVLHGEPPFDLVRVSMGDLRLQLEQQVMGKLLQLRQGALLAGTDAKRQATLMASSLSTMLVLFRAVLRLHGERPADDSIAVAHRVGVLAGFDAAPYERVLRHVREEQTIPSAETSTTLGGYMAGLQRLKAYLDVYISPS